MPIKLSTIFAALILLTPLFSQAASYTYTSTYSNTISTSSLSADGRASVSVDQYIRATSNSEITTSGTEQVSTSTQQSSEVHIEAYSGGTTQSGSSGENGTDGKDGTNRVQNAAAAALARTPVYPTMTPASRVQFFGTPVPKPSDSIKPSAGSTPSPSPTLSPIATVTSPPTFQRMPARLFGIFPMHIQVRTTIDTNGQIKVKFPWYRIFFWL